MRTATSSRSPVMLPATKTQDVTVLRNAMLFSLTRHAWSNHRKADKSKFTADANKAKLNMTKRLIESAELDAITDHLNEVYNWCLARAMPSTSMRRGVYFVKKSMIPEFEAKLAEFREELRTKYVPAFMRTYADAKAKAALPADKGGLGALFNAGDYPADPGSLFGLEWSWLALGVPDDLPDEIRARESAKLRESFLEAQEEIKFALREGFKTLIDHAVERLTPAADGTVKVFRDSLLTNFKDFFETFNARNLMDDAELARVVAEARAIVTGIPDADRLRTSADTRVAAMDKFAQVRSVIDGLVAEKPKRKFDLVD